MTELQTGLLSGCIFLTIVWGCAFIARSDRFPDINDGKETTKATPKTLL